MRTLNQLNRLLIIGSGLAALVSCGPLAEKAKPLNPSLVDYRNNYRSVENFGLVSRLGWVGGKDSPEFSVFVLTEKNQESRAEVKLPMRISFDASSHARLARAQEAGMPVLLRSFLVDGSTVLAQDEKEAGNLSRAPLGIHYDGNDYSLVKSRGRVTGVGRATGYVYALIKSGKRKRWGWVETTVNAFVLRTEHGAPLVCRVPFSDEGEALLLRAQERENEVVVRRLLRERQADPPTLASQEVILDGYSEPGE